MLRNVYFEGEIGDKFLPHMQIDCETTAEVFKCMDANFSEFMPYLIEKHEEDVGFHIEVCGEELEYPEECLMEIGEGDIIITPIPAGAGKSFGKILAAIAIVVVMAAIGGYAFIGNSMISFSAAVGAAASGIAGKIALGLALSLAISGVAEMMAPDPSVDADFEQDQSYLFSGQQQNIIQGDPVPVLYGRLRVPGQPISFELVGATTATPSLTSGHGGTIVEGATSYFSSKIKDTALAT